MSAAVGAGHVMAAGQRVVGVDREGCGHGADEAGFDALGVEHFVGRRQPEPGAQRVAQLELVQLVIAPQQDHERLAGAVAGRAVRFSYDDQRLHERPRGQPQELADLGDGARLGRGLDLVDQKVDRRCARGDLAERRLAVGAGHRQLDVRRIAALRAEDDLVLAGLGGRHVGVRDVAAHHARVLVDHPAVDAAALVDAVVGADVLLVAHLERLVVDVEAVGVLHEELARAQDAALGARLVAFLGLDVVPELGELPVGVDLARRQPGDDLFVGHGQRHVGAPAVLEAEHLFADVVPAAALLPDLGRLQHRHEHLLAADSIHLFTDDGGDLPHHPPAGRQIHVDAGRELTDETGPDHELVAHGLGPGRVLFDCRQKERARAHGAR